MLKKITSFFNKTFSNDEQKAAASFSPYASLLGYYSGFGFTTSSLQWMTYYGTAAPMGDAIDKIADECAKIELILQAEDENEVDFPVHDHPFLELLNHPNPYQTYGDFVKESIVHERATGNSYMYFIGGISATKDKIIGNPIEVYNLRPDLMTINPDPIDGRALYYQYTSANGNLMTFYRAELRDINGKICQAYVETNGYGLLFHFKNTSTRRSGAYYQLLGDPPLQSAQIQIAQYLAAANYNYMLLTNGLSAKKIISLDTKEMPTQQQSEQLKRFMNEEFSGSNNAGKSIVSTIPLKVSDLAVKLTDMDFKSLDERTTTVIYRQLNIPLPLISAEHTALANMETSYLMFFDNAILPTFDRFSSRLFTFPFKQYYKDSDQFLGLGYNESAIGALQPRIAENVNKLKQSGIATVNELREYQGLSRIDSDGADDIYMPINFAPIGTDTNLIDTIGIERQKKPKKKVDEKRLREELRKTLTYEGLPLYSEEEIEALIKYG